jgi:hypothetical protein
MRENATRDRQREHNVAHKTFGPKLYARARITNGRGLLPGVDKRSIYGPRMRDHVGLLVSDLGGIEAVSAAERSLVQRIACLTVECEHMEGRFARAEGATAGELLLYGATVKTLNRLIQTVGLRRRPRDVSLDLGQYLAGQASPSPSDSVSSSPDLDTPPGS